MGRANKINNFLAMILKFAHKIVGSFKKTMGILILSF